MTLSPFRMNTYKKPGGESSHKVNSQPARPPSRRQLCVTSAPLSVSALSFFLSPSDSTFITSLLLYVIASPFPCNLSSVPKYSSAQRQFTANAEMTATE